MNNIYFTADTHFSHANIVRFSKRPQLKEGDLDSKGNWINKQIALERAEEMDEMLIKNWNDIIKPNDIVYHLGDVVFAPIHKANEILNRLNGKIYLILGNHDKSITSSFENKKRFEWIKDVAMIRVGEQQLFLSHYCHTVWNKSHHGVYHLYGHSHGSLPDDPHSYKFDVGVDCHDYKPISIDRVHEIMKTKIFKPKDHHTNE